MDRLIGKKVTHAGFGEGTIIGTSISNIGKKISVQFPSDEKEFPFPSAIGKFLEVGEDVQIIAEEIRIAEEAAIREAEEAHQRSEAERKIEEERKEAERRQKVIDNSLNIAKNTDRTKPFSKDAVRIFKVHQGQSFKIESVDGFVWAPDDTDHHHQKMKEIKEGDIIFHTVDGEIKAVGEALTNCYPALKPISHTGTTKWGADGLRVEVRYQLLDPVLPLAPLKSAIVKMRAGKYLSFDKNGNGCVGYMFDLELDIARLFKTEILKTSQPTGVIGVLNRIK